MFIGLPVAAPEAFAGSEFLFSRGSRRDEGAMECQTRSFSDVGVMGRQTEGVVGQQTRSFSDVGVMGRQTEGVVGQQTHSFSDVGVMGRQTEGVVGQQTRSFGINRGSYELLALFMTFTESAIGDGIEAK